VFAVGGGGAVAHYDGAQWSLQRAPDFGPGWFNLFAVWGSSAHDVYAVGGGGWCFHYDGVQWTAQPRLTTNPLYSVWGSSANDVTVGGFDGSLFHFNGHNWNAVQLN
jgi:hypothetical protein